MRNDPPTATFAFQVDLTLAELLKFQSYMMLFRLRFWSLALLWSIVVLVMVVQLATGAVSLRDGAKPAALFIGIPLVLVGVTAVAVQRNYDRVWKPQLPVSYAFDGEGVATSAPNASSEIRWAGIEELKVWQGLLLVFLNRHCALIIPRRCVGADADRLVAFIEQKIGKPT